MMALVLAGGKGTRLHPLTLTIPKPLMPLGDLPILEVVIRQLSAAGVKRIVISVGHMAHFFAAFLERWMRYGAAIELCYEDEPLGTAGSIALVPNLTDNFLVMNGDLLTTIDYASLIKAHIQADAWGTIALSRRELKVDYGIVRTDERGRLEKYEEKPTITYEVSMGINVLSRRCVEYIKRGSRIDIPDLMQRMTDGGRTVLCFPTTCYWQDIGRLDDLQQASRDFIDNPARFLPQNQ